MYAKSLISRMLQLAGLYDGGPSGILFVNFFLTKDQQRSGLAQSAEQVILRSCSLEGNGQELVNLLVSASDDRGTKVQDLVLTKTCPFGEAQLEEFRRKTKENNSSVRFFIEAGAAGGVFRMSDLVKSLQQDASSEIGTNDLEHWVFDISDFNVGEKENFVNFHAGIYEMFLSHPGTFGKQGVCRLLSLG